MRRKRLEKGREKRAAKGAIENKRRLNLKG